MRKRLYVVTIMAILIIAGGCGNLSSVKEGKHEYSEENDMTTMQEMSLNEDSTEMITVNKVDVGKENEGNTNLEAIDDGVELQAMEDGKQENAVVESKQKIDRDGFGEFNNILEVGGIQMEMPNYWIWAQSEEKTICVADFVDGRFPNAYMEIYASEPTGVTMDIKALQVILKNVTKNLNEEYRMTYWGHSPLSAYWVTGHEQLSGEYGVNDVDTIFVPFICEQDDRYYVLMFYEKSDSEYSYVNDLEKTLSSARQKEDDTEKQVVSNKSETKNDSNKKEYTSNNQTEKKETTSKSGVDPDMKAFLDSYEEFVDKYVVFMKKYLGSTSSGDYGELLAMYQDYMDILKQLEEFQQKADNYNSKNMSKEDLAYYLDSLNRIQKKMLEVY